MNLNDFCPKYCKVSTVNIPAVCSSATFEFLIHLFPNQISACLSISPEDRIFSECEVMSFKPIGLHPTYNKHFIASLHYENTPMQYIEIFFHL